MNRSLRAIHSPCSGLPVAALCRLFLFRQLLAWTLCLLQEVHQKSSSHGFEHPPPSASACSRTTPMPSFEASLDTLILFVGLKNASTGAVVSVSLSLCHSWSCSSVHIKLLSLCRSSQMQDVVADKFGMNFLTKLTIRTMRNTAVLSVGLGMSCMALIFSWSG